jgi:serine/threonine-protein kinase
LDPGLVEAHNVLGSVYQQTWRWAAARAEFEKSIDLSPNDASAHLGLADWLLCHGKMDEALSESDRARQLDPFGVSGRTNGWILFQARRYDEAARELRSVPPEHPDYASAQFNLGFVLIAKGQFKAAVDVLEHTVELTRGAPGVKAMLIHAYARAGQRDDALRLLNEMKEKRRTSYVPAGAFVNVYAGFQDREQTFYWLERSYEEHSNILQFIETHPHFDFIRDDPRFKDLERRVGLR